MNLNTRLHILGHVALKLAALAGALGGLLLITTIMLPPRAAQASSPDLQAAIAAGGYHTCALKGGQVYCWGWNDLRPARRRDDDGSQHADLSGGRRDGQQRGDRGRRRLASHLRAEGREGLLLGDGTSSASSATGRRRIAHTPTLVADGAMGNSGVTAVAAGGSHTCALKGGQVYCWGWNNYGQLGDGTRTDRNTPTLVADGAMGNSGVTAVAAGDSHTCALKGGKVYCWGYNGDGQLGDGTTTNRNTPTLVADGAMGNSGVTAVAAGAYHTCALKGGQVYCWGWNGDGQLGDGTTTNRNTPTLVADGAMGNSGVTAVAAGWVTPAR
jgi:alpha-tubulin suppressor-like RCC1 family protein